MDEKKLTNFRTTYSLTWSVVVLGTRSPCLLPIGRRERYCDGDQ